MGMLNNSHFRFVVILFVALAKCLSLRAIEPLPVRYSLEGRDHERWGRLHAVTEGSNLYYIYAPDFPGSLLHETHFVDVPGVLYHIYEPRWIVALFRGETNELLVYCAYGQILYMFPDVGEDSSESVDISKRSIRIPINDDTANLLEQAWRVGLEGVYRPGLSTCVRDVIGMRGVYCEGEFHTNLGWGSYQEIAGCYSSHGFFSLGSAYHDIGSVLFSTLLTDDQDFHAEQISKVEVIAENIVRLHPERRERLNKEAEAIQAKLDPQTDLVFLEDPFVHSRPKIKPALSPQELEQIKHDLCSIYAEYYEISPEDAKKTYVDHGFWGRLIRGNEYTEEPVVDEVHGDPFAGQ